MSDLIDVIIEDHRHVQRCFDQLESDDCSQEQRKDLVEHVIAELVRHSVAEEMHMYPAAREAIPDGDRIADHEIEEHAEAEKVMSDLMGKDPGDPEFDELLRNLISDVRHHIDDEEQDLLPKLRDNCTSEQLQELGAKVQDAKESAPTRPHPLSPDKPPANRLLDPGAGLIDRMRDALSDRTT
jgi:hemerythrin superfamily protein